MTLVLEATPSSGGPRCLRSRGSRGSRGSFGLESAASSVLTAVSFCVLGDLFVASVKGSTWPGTFVGASVEVASVPSPLACDYSQSSCIRHMHLCHLQYVLHERHGLLVHGRGPLLCHDHVQMHGGESRYHCHPLHRWQHPRQMPQACERAGCSPCGRECFGY